MARKVTATEASRSFSSLLSEVQHHGETFAIVRNGKIVAELRAPKPAGLSPDEATRILQAGPRLDPADAMRFHDDVSAAKSKLRPVASEWD